MYSSCLQKETTTLSFLIYKGECTHFHTDVDMQKWALHIFNSSAPATEEGCIVSLATNPKIPNPELKSPIYRQVCTVLSFQTMNTKVKVIEMMQTKVPCKTGPWFLASPTKRKTKKPLARQDFAVWAKGSSEHYLSDNSWEKKRWHLVVCTPSEYLITSFLHLQDHNWIGMIFKSRKHLAEFYLYQTSFRSCFSLKYKRMQLKESPKPRLLIQVSLIAYEEQSYCNWRQSAETKPLKTALSDPWYSYSPINQNKNLGHPYFQPGRRREKKAAHLRSQRFSVNSTEYLVELLKDTYSTPTPFSTSPHPPISVNSNFNTFSDTAGQRKKDKAVLFCPTRISDWGFFIPSIGLYHSHPLIGK